ncbi:hypothetical protein RvY_10799 [Ramazzottius varieornatus]|uniref:Uncharacterized protein n=1 Tax=Ramazzottius varieornatus TaxID=947166 RepID=A0A1D1VDZ4_RAMVA|nr:hypothetical protein RvY_10799 [Ramazzottius varieornatus]
MDLAGTGSSLRHIFLAVLLVVRASAFRAGDTYVCRFFNNGSNSCYSDCPPFTTNAKKIFALESGRLDPMYHLVCNDNPVSGPWETSDGFGFSLPVNKTDDYIGSCIFNVRKNTEWECIGSSVCRIDTVGSRSCVPSAPLRGLNYSGKPGQRMRAVA